MIVIYGNILSGRFQKGSGIVSVQVFENISLLKIAFFFSLSNFLLKDEMNSFHWKSNSQKYHITNES